MAKLPDFLCDYPSCFVYEVLCYRCHEGDAQEAFAFRNSWREDRVDVDPVVVQVLGKFKGVVGRPCHDWDDWCGGVHYLYAMAAERGSCIIGYGFEPFNDIGL